jgi:benzodiazapine receptor
MASATDQLGESRLSGAFFGRLLLCFLLCFSAAGFGAMFTPGEWYAALVKPPLTPPNWVFGPVWTLLYTLMAISAAIVWNRAGSLANLGRTSVWFLVQITLNALWSAIFFGLHTMGLALLEILLLWCTIAVTIRCFAAISKPAAWLLVPYLCWVSLATWLNAGLWWLNRSGG